VRSHFKFQSTELVEVEETSSNDRFVTPDKTRNELRELCKRYGLPVTAKNKNELVERINRKIAPSPREMSHLQENSNTQSFRVSFTNHKYLKD